MGSDVRLVRRSAAALALVCACLLAASPASARPPGERLDPGQPQGDWAPGELIVRFKPGAGKAARGMAHAVRGARVTERIGAFHTDVVRLPPWLSVQEALAAYEADPLVEVAEPNYRRHLAAPAPPADLWSLHNEGQLHPVSPIGGAPSPDDAAGIADADIDAPEAWAVLDLEPVLASPIVAVVDSGVDVDHPDLAGRFWVDPEDGSHGYDVAEDDMTLLAPAATPGYDHGTHVAGTIAADPGAEVAGVCPACLIMVVKVMDDDGDILLSSLLAGLDFARENGAHIVNLSLGATGWSPSEHKAIKRLSKAGVLVVASAGNRSADNDVFVPGLSPEYPASYDLPNVVSVAASNHEDDYAYSTACVTELGERRVDCAFTNWGQDSVDLAAPGADVKSTVPGGGYDTWDGTSMAAPHVSGVAGLLLSGEPGLKVGQLRNKLLRGVDEPGFLGRLHARHPLMPRKLFHGSFTRTDGRLNAELALGASTSALPRTDGNIAGAKKMRKRVRGRVAWPHDVNDVYRKRLVRGRKYVAILRGPNKADLDLYVWRQKTKEIWQPGKLAGAGISPNAKERIRFKARKTRAHYFQVAAWLRESGKYRLVVRPR